MAGSGTHSLVFSRTSLPGVCVIDPAVYKDARGFFAETYHFERYHAAGLIAEFVQDNHSRSARHTLRGLHAQINFPQTKLVRVLSGTVWDVAVDIRKGSPTFGQWTGVELSAENFKQLYIPTGFAHGFVVLSETADVEYKCSDFYHPEDQLHLLWDDPDLAIQWPVRQPLLSEKDQNALSLKAIEHRLPAFSKIEKL